MWKEGLTNYGPLQKPVPNCPRLRALALFGRRPVECAGLSLLPASKNQHNIRAAVVYRSRRATKRSARTVYLIMKMS
jgi:hypothetical protein